MYPAPLVYDQQIHTPPENPNQQNPPKKEATQQKKQTVKDPLSILTPQKKQILLHIIHKSQKDTNNLQHLQKYSNSKKNLSNIILTLSQLTTYPQSSKYFHQIHPQFLAPPAPQVVPIFMANIQQQQQPPPPQQPAP